MICAFEDSIMESGVRKLCGQRPIAPSAVFDQSSARTRAPISPPPCSQSSLDDGAGATLRGRTRSLRLRRGARRVVVGDLTRAPQETAWIDAEVALELVERTLAALPCPSSRFRRSRYGRAHGVAYTLRRSSTSASSHDSSIAA